MFILVQTIFWSLVTISLFVVRPSGQLTHKYGARLWARVLLWGSRVRVSLQGIENLTRTRGPVVLVSNH
ncbi:MAG: hypothetical protein JRJ59_13320, partial [Deltaproteobacteria bacterium]|nr:hypothetical protein [Deltaproteobacteria bacterium]